MFRFGFGFDFEEFKFGLGFSLDSGLGFGIDLGFCLGWVSQYFICVWDWFGFGVRDLVLELSLDFGF